jgi:nucleoside diphosphate kinase
MGRHLSAFFVSLCCTAASAGHFSDTSLPGRHEIICPSKSLTSRIFSPAFRCGGSQSHKNKSVPLKNSALVFVKPHANTESVQDYVRDALEQRGIVITSEFDISADEIDKKKLIDKHYYAIASKATILTPDKIPVPKDKFEEFFGEKYDKVLKEGRAANAMEACTKFGCDATALDGVWREAEAQSKVVKLGGGFYCGLLSYEGCQPLYVFNAFFMQMRDKFVKGAGIHVYEVEWDSEKLRWKDFRGRVLGSTDPSAASKGSIRNNILRKYREFGLDYAPNKGDNGVHASASPFEGLAEKMNWANKSAKEDPFGNALLSRGLSAKRLSALSLDPQVQLSNGSKASVFDTLEDMDVEECLDIMTSEMK